MENIDISYSRNNNESNMIIEGNVVSKPFEEKMIISNDINCLMEFYTLQVNGKTRYHYNISGKESLSDYLESEELTQEKLSKLILYIHLAVEELRKYLIDESHIIVSPKTVYLNRSAENYGVKLCYFPAADNETVTNQFMSDLEKLLSVVDHENERLRELTYRLYEIATRSDYTLMELVKEINGNQETLMVDDTESQDVLDDVFLPKEEVMCLYEDDYDIWDKISDFFASLVKRKEKTTDKSVQEDFILEPQMELDEPTVMLKPEEKLCLGKLIYDGNSPVDEDDFMVQKDIFRIGALRANNDACLRSKAVSRHHAKITRRGTDYYIEDLNSTNGTLVNVILLNDNEPRKLNMLDTIVFGDVAYVFM